MFRPGGRLLGRCKSRLIIIDDVNNPNYYPVTEALSKGSGGMCKQLSSMVS